MRDVDLRCADCLDPVSGLPSLGDGAVDVVITDPPFSPHVHRNLGREERADGGRRREALDFEALTVEAARALAAQFCRVARRWIVIFTDERTVATWADAIEAAGGEYVRGGTWVKIGASPQMSGDRPGSGTESIVVAHAPRARGAGRMRWNGGGRPAVWTFPIREPGVERIHPTQKPLALCEALVRDFTADGETICDPFLGSGSILVAARKLGRSVVGWERDPRYFEAARRRIEETRVALALPLDGPRKQLRLAGAGR